MSADSYIETVLESLYDAKSQLSEDDFATVLEEVKLEMNRM